MKKRLTGVAVLVFIGVAIPFLLSRCMGGGGDTSDDGQMRVYEISPGGDAARSDDSAANDTGSGRQGAGSRGQAANGSDDGYGGGRSGVQHPEALSPNHVAGDSDESDNSDNERFSTPPVSGNSRSSGAATDGGQKNPPPSRAPSQSASSSAPSQPAPGASSSSSGGYGSDSASSGGGSTERRGSPGTGWVVQVASFTKSSSARGLANQLSDQFKAYFKSGDVNGKTYYRVRVGPFDSKSAAEQAAGRLRQQGQQTLVQHLP